MRSMYGKTSTFQQIKLKALKNKTQRIQHMKYTLAGSRIKPTGNESSLYNINIKFYDSNELIAWLKDVNKEDTVSPDIEHIIDMIEDGKNMWFNTKYFMFCAKPIR